MTEFNGSQRVSTFRILTIKSLLCIFLFIGTLVGSLSASDSPLVCEEGSFTCADNSRCYGEGDRCDRINDCDDGTDEKDCNSGVTCTEGEFYCEADENCLPNHYQCDGQDDCSDGTDESSCANVTCQVEGEFMCVSDRNCIVEALRCDGTRHCHDGSDEQDCREEETTSCDSYLEYDCAGDGSHCIPFEKTCDGHEDCSDGRDERESRCVTNSTSPCSIENGGCSQKCVTTPDGYHCGCLSGYELGYDRKTCEDIDECESNAHACSHTCQNSDGGYSCACLNGYRLSEDTYSCLADGEEPEIWVSNGTTLIQHHLHSKDRTITNLGESIHAISYSYKQKKIFLIDSSKKAIYWTDKSSADAPVAFVDNLKDVPIAIAYDWVHDNLYWANSGAHSKIEIITVEDRYRAIILNHTEVDHPKLVVIDPRADESYIYWAQGATNAVIRRADLDGSDPQTIVSTDLQSVNGLTIDFVANRLYWVDSKLNIIASLGLQDNDREVLETFVDYPKHLIGMAVFEDYAYWGDIASSSVQMIYKFRVEGENSATPVVDHVTKPRALEIYHKMKQPEEENHCATNNGGCSHICLPTTRHYVKRRCACPMTNEKTKHYIVNPDNSSNCILIDHESTLHQKTAQSVTPVVMSSASAQSQTNFIILKSFLSTAYLSATTTSKWASKSPGEKGSEAGQEGSHHDGDASSKMWIYIAVGGVVGLLIIIILSVVGYKLYAHHVSKNLHFDNPVFEQKPLRSSHQQADSRA